MNVLVVGLGSIGKRHLTNIFRVDSGARVTVWHQSGRLHPDESLHPGVEVVNTFDDAIRANPQVAILSNPASAHVQTAVSLAELGIHLLIEKPLSNRLDRIEQLVATCREHSVQVMLGYNFRFYQPLMVMRQAMLNQAIGKVLFARAEVGQYLPDWRPGQDYRQVVSARQDLGGGVLLELSHEVDYSRWFFGEVAAVSATVQRIGRLEIDVDDYAEMILEYDSGIFQSIHLDMLRRAPKRVFEINGENGILVWDGISHEVSLFSAEKRHWSKIFTDDALDRNEMYLAELRHFFACVRQNCQPAPGLLDGIQALEVIFAAQRAEERGCRVPVKRIGS